MGECDQPLDKGLKKIKIFKSFLRQWFNNKNIIIVTHLSYGVLVYMS